MKDEKTLLTAGAGIFAAMAAKDASIRNAIGKASFTPSQIAKAMGWGSVLEMYYGSLPRKTEYNFRAGRKGAINPTKFIVVKIFTDLVRDPKGLKTAESGLETDPMFVRMPAKRKTSGGEVLYRLYF